MQARSDAESARGRRGIGSGPAGAGPAGAGVLVGVDQVLERSEKHVHKSCFGTWAGGGRSWHDKTVLDFLTVGEERTGASWMGRKSTWPTLVQESNPSPRRHQPRSRVRTSTLPKIQIVSDATPTPNPDPVVRTPQVLKTSFLSPSPKGLVRKS